MDSGIGKSLDRISKLPDSVLCHILSFLPTKYAVGTSILSKRWQYLWASVPNFDFEDSLLFHEWGTLSEDRKSEVQSSFMNFVNRVLLLTDVSCFQKFHLNLGLRCNNFNLFDTWICAAIKHNVQELKLDYDGDFFHVSLPPMLYTSKTLVFLKLSGEISLELPTSVWLPSLKILHLESIEYQNEDSAQLLFSGCPLLEELFIRKWTSDTQRVLNICIPTLKRLMVQRFIDEFSESIDESADPGCKLMVSGAKLELLYLQDIVSEDFLLENLSSLSTALVDVGCTCSTPIRFKSYCGCIYKLLSGITNIKSLSLSVSTLSCLFSVDDYILPTFHDLTCLKLGADDDSVWNLLPKLLECSPNLEVLILEKGWRLPDGSNCEIVICKKGHRLLNSAKCWSPPRQVPNCLLLHLKEVKINRFNGNEYELEAVEYLLRNAKVLKKMTIDCGGLNTNEDFQVFKKLAMFPRDSRTCQLSLLF